MPSPAAEISPRGDASASKAVVDSLMAIPDYVPEFPENDKRLEKYRHQPINVLELGARADGQSHPLRQVFKDQASIDTRYGAGRYGLEDEADYVAVMEAIRIAKGVGEYIPAIKAVKYAGTVYLPRGVYLINRTIPLTDTIGGTIRGDGREQTVIRFNAAEPLFAISRCAHMSFADMVLESAIASHGTCFFVTNPEEQQKRFGKPTFNFTFDGLIFQRFFKAIQITGHVMTDSMVFTKCRFLQCLTSFQLQNPQGLNYQFLGCNFEAAGDPATFAPYKAEDTVIFHVQAGGDITVIGGNIIHSGITLLLEPDDTLSPDHGPSPAISWGSGIYNFYGARWEQMGGSNPGLFDVKGKGRYTARINFDSCMVYQRVAALNKPMGMLYPGLNVTFRNSVCNAGTIEEVIVPDQENRKSTLILDNTSGLKYHAVPEPAAYHHTVQVR